MAITIENKVKVSKWKIRKGCRRAVRILTLVIPAALLLTACGNDFGDINVNPNAPTITNPDYLFSYALVVGAQMDGNRDFGVWAGLTASDEGLERRDNIYLPSELAIYTWKDCFSVIANLNEIVAMLKDDPYYVNKFAVARIWRAYLFERLTDLYGDIPFSQASKGNTDAFIISPAYDRQDSIYPALLNELKEAVNLINDTADLGNYDNADLIYNGNLENWKRFGTSLRLRMALRISNVMPELAEQVATEVMESGLLMESADDGFHFQFNKDFKAATYYFYEAGLARSVPSKFLIDMLMATDDPRLAVYAQHPEKGDSVLSYRGMPNGLTVDERIADGYNFKTVSHVGSYFLREDIAGFTMSYAEVCFMKAEAALKGWGATSADAETYYNEGVTESMLFFKTFTPSSDLQVDPFTEITDTQITDYLAAAGKYEGSDEQKLEKIITQRWLTLYQEGGYEAFALVRRTHYPSLTHYDGAFIDLDNDYVQRMPYPVEEYSLNGTHTRAAEERQTDKVWWSK